MALQLTPESFLAVVKQSGLIDVERLQRLLNEFRLRGIKLDQARTIADELVASNGLTRWQAEKLLQGKHRGFFLGKYRLLSLLGKGGMSSVYLAEHTLMRRRCAIKVLPTKRVHDTSYLGRFHREAQAVANLDHPNIVRAYDVDKEVEGNTEIHFLVMEYVDGESLQEQVVRNGVFDFVTAAENTRQAAEGLIHAHSIGMVHRDIKPGNLLVDTNGVVKILDMGLARFFDEGDNESLTVTHDEKVLGTADYLAPEQALDSHTVDARADIYSLGCTVYYLLTGHPPFTEGTLAQRLMSHQVKEPPSITVDRPETPVDLLAIIEKMMAKKVSDRYQSAAEVSEALFDWLLANGGDDWKRKHTPAGSSDPSLTGESLRSASPSGLGLTGSDRSLSSQASPQVGLQTNESKTGKIADDTASISASETGTVSGSSLAQPQTSKPSSSNSLEEIPLAPIDEEEQQEAGLVKPERKPAPGDSSPGKSSPRVGDATKSAGSTQKKQSGSPAPNKTKPASKSDVAATHRPVKKTAGDSSPGPRPKPAQPGQSPRPNKQIVARKADAPDVEIVEALPIESPTPLAEPLTPRTGTFADSGIRRSSESYISRSRRQSREKAILAGAGILLLLLVAVIVFVVVSSNESDLQDVGTGAAFDGGLGKKKDVTVGPQGEFASISAALEHVRTNFVPKNKYDRQIIRVAGGQIYRESLTLDNSTSGTWPEGIRLICSDNDKAVLFSAGGSPALSLNAVSRFTFEGFELQAKGSPVAVELRGNLAGTKLKGLKISGFSQTGILAEGARGEGADQRDRAIVITQIEILGESRQSVGLQFNNSEFVSVWKGRFIGPLRTAVLLSGSNGPLGNLLIQESIFTRTETGIKIEPGVSQLSRLTLWNNTFFNVRHGIVFSTVPTLPADGVGELKILGNLFAGNIVSEAILKSGDPQAILSMASGEGIQSNWSKRSAVAGTEPSEIDIFAKDGHRGVQFQFRSTDLENEAFLVPISSAPHSSAGALPP